MWKRTWYGTWPASGGYGGKDVTGGTLPGGAARRDQERVLPFPLGGHVVARLAGARAWRAE